MIISCLFCYNEALSCLTRDILIDVQQLFISNFLGQNNISGTNQKNALYLINNVIRSEYQYVQY